MEQARISDDLLKLSERKKRGYLKVYLGSAAGVGKTYRMLLKAQHLKEVGTDVVIGYVEPHDRPDTIAQTQGLEVVPPKITKHGNLELKEMDAEAVIERHPTVVLGHQCCYDA
jgi:two-component system sensor histidine kinase KdpD